MAFKMKGSAFKQSGSGIQGTSGHRSALKQHNEESPVKNTFPHANSTGEVGSAVEWERLHNKKHKDALKETPPRKWVHTKKEGGIGGVPMKSPVKQQTVVEDEQALPFNPDAISNVPGYMQSKVTGGGDWTVHEETPKTGKGITYRGEGGRYHIYDPTKHEGHKLLMPGGEPVDMSKSMWDQQTQSWVPKQEFTPSVAEEGDADMTNVPPVESQPLEDEGNQGKRKPWWKRRRS